MKEVIDPPPMKSATTTRSGTTTRVGEEKRSDVKSSAGLAAIVRGKDVVRT
jgi:hypothetical protein